MLPSLTVCQQLRERRARTDAKDRPATTYCVETGNGPRVRPGVTTECDARAIEAETLRKAEWPPAPLRRPVGG